MSRRSPLTGAPHHHHHHPISSEVPTKLKENSTPMEEGVDTSKGRVAHHGNAVQRFLNDQTERIHTAIDRCARGESAGFARAASRFYLISRPFWVAPSHAPGFHYYPETRTQNVDIPTQAYPLEGADAVKDGKSSNASVTVGGVAATAAAPVGPHFRHTKLNSPALIPRAVRPSSATSSASSSSKKKKTILFTSPSSSPFLAPLQQPHLNRKLPNANVNEGLDAFSSQSRARSSSEPIVPPIYTYRGLHTRVYNFFHGTPRRIAWSWSLLMIALLVFCTYLHVAMSYCHRNMSTSLGKRDAQQFYETLVLYLCTTLVASPLLSISQYAKSQLSLHWRIYLTNKILQQYFQHRNYYYLQSANGAGAGNSSAAPTSAETKLNGGRRKASSLESMQSEREPNTRNAEPPLKRSKSSMGQSKSKSKNSIDNPDQRIADDIRAFTRSSLTFVNELLDEIFQVIAFAGILYSISPMLVAGLVVYALLGTYLATVVFGLQLIETNSKQSKLEADFRFSLVRVRTNAEAIAFYSGEHAELSYIYWRFSKIVRNLSRMAGIQCNLAFFKHGYGFLTMLIPPFFLAPLYFDGHVELGVISQASMAFRQIFNSLNMVVSKMNELSKWRSGMERIWELEIHLEKQDAAAARHIAARRRSISLETVQHDRERQDRESANIVSWTNEARLESSTNTTIQVRPSQHLHIDHLMVCVQGDPMEKIGGETGKGKGEEGGAPAPGTHLRILVKNLTLFLPSLQQEELNSFLLQNPSSLGRGLLIMGRSGIGKSTLLRAIAGLWKNGRGVIYRPNLSALLFLPQRPYMILGTLRQQLLYPFCPQTSTTSHTGVGRQGALGTLESGSILEETSESISISSPGSLGSTSSPFGIRRRWPVGSKSLTGALSECTPSSPGVSPSPPPPSSTDLTNVSEGVPSDEDLEHILRIVNLAHLTKPKPNEKGELISGLDVLCDWSEVLSLAALDAQNEEKLYSALSTYAPRTCLVSVGHRPALLKHHSHVLHLQEGGNWELLEINQQNQQAIDHITAVTTTT